jgi:hypothetical protein
MATFFVCHFLKSEKRLLYHKVIKKMLNLGTRGAMRPQRHSAVTRSDQMKIKVDIVLAMGKCL